MPRSNPDGIGVTLGCVDWGSGERPSVIVKKYDGNHWERSWNETNISDESLNVNRESGREGGREGGGKSIKSRSPSRSSALSLEEVEI